MTLVSIVAVLHELEFLSLAPPWVPGEHDLNLPVRATLSAGIATHIIEARKPLHHSEVDSQDGTGIVIENNCGVNIGKDSDSNFMPIWRK